jgi:hypothetical protein
LIDEFIKLAHKKAETAYETDADRRKFLVPIYGVYSKDPLKKVDGISYTTKWAMYVDKIAGGNFVKFGRVEIGKLVKKKINSISAIESSDSPLGTDPFTDLDEGRALKIIFNPNAEQADDYYTTSIDSSTVTEELPDGRKVQLLRTYPVSDDRLMTFLGAPPLAKMYREVFKRSDFDIQLTGLQLLDKQYNMGIVETEEFQRIAEEIAQFFPVEESAKTETATPVQQTSPTVENKPDVKPVFKSLPKVSAGNSAVPSTSLITPPLDMSKLPVSVPPVVAKKLPELTDSVMVSASFATVIPVPATKLLNRRSKPDFEAKTPVPVPRFEAVLISPVPPPDVVLVIVMVSVPTENATPVPATSDFN